jgi:hypothetical protein
MSTIREAVHCFVPVLLCLHRTLLCPGKMLCKLNLLAFKL